jgi:hypothetical protein
MADMRLFESSGLISSNNLQGYDQIVKYHLIRRHLKNGKNLIREKSYKKNTSYATRVYWTVLFFLKPMYVRNLSLPFQFRQEARRDL